MAKRKTQKSSRPTIAFLTDEMLYEYQFGIWNGVASAAEEKDINLICAVGRSLRSPYEFESQSNIIYDLISQENVNGVIIMGASMGARIDITEMLDFCQKYRPLPIVSIGLSLEGIPSLLIDNEKGMRDVLTHFLEDHNYRRIAFIRGPAFNKEAEIRYRTYVNVLTEYGIPLETNLVIPGDFLRPTGTAAVEILLNERNVEFDAIIAANDRMALGALDALRARGMRVPHDVALAGFDNAPETKISSPPLTTVGQPLEEQGRKALDMLLAVMQDQEVAHEITLPTHAIIRQSCGCVSNLVLNAKVEIETPPTDSLQEALDQQHDRILAAIVAQSEPDETELDPEQIERLWQALVGELIDTSSTFYNTLETLLEEGQAESFTAWQNIISAMRQHILPYVLNTDMQMRAENLWQQARVMISETIQRSQAYQRYQMEHQNLQLLNLDRALSTTIDLDNMASVLRRNLPQLGIPSAYVSLYEGEEAPSKQSTLIIGYDDQGQLAPETSIHYPTHELVPSERLKLARRRTLIVMPLYFRKEQLGFSLLEAGPKQGNVYESLRDQLSGAIKGALILQQVETRATKIQTAAEISRIVSGILKQQDLFQQIVDLVRERFDLYYAGLFLVDQTGEWSQDEPGKWAVLRAGTGEAGEKMLTQNHKLEIGSTSMIGWCIENKRARIALDVGEEAVRFDNPFLPHTRSEMALPLISRNHAVGALTIQSEREADFSEEDVVILQTMASQVANAIENTRLFEQTQSALNEIKAVHQRYLQKEWSEYLKMAETVKYETPHPSEPEIGDQILPEIEKAMHHKRVTAVKADSNSGEGGREALIAPIILRDTVIGALGVHDDPGRQWTENEVALIEAISDRLAVAAENLRLVEETQSRAAREQMIRQMSERMQRALDIETLIKTTLQEISTAIGTPHAFVKFHVPEDESRND